jgi:hypothetical protein
MAVDLLPGGLPPIILGLVTIFYLSDRPQQARWLPEMTQLDYRGAGSREAGQEKKFATTRSGKLLANGKSSC